MRWVGSFPAQSSPTPSRCSPSRQCTRTAAAPSSRPATVRVRHHIEMGSAAITAGGRPPIFHPHMTAATACVAAITFVTPHGVHIILADIAHAEPQNDNAPALLESSDRKNYSDGGTAPCVFLRVPMYYYGYFECLSTRLNPLAEGISTPGHHAESKLLLVVLHVIKLGGVRRAPPRAAPRRLVGLY
jgi:hypothetical protein